MSIKNYAELLQEVTAISQTYVKDGDTIYVMTEKGKKYYIQVKKEEKW